MTMSYRKFKELLNKKLDGSASVADLVKYEEYITMSEKAHVYASEMENLHNQLQQSGSKQPEIDVSNKVMDRIHKTRSKPRTPIALLQSRMLSINPMYLQFTALLIIGLLIGSVATFVVVSNPSAPDARLAGGTFSATPGGSLYFRGDTWQIQASSVIIDKEINLMISLKTETDLEVSLRFEPRIYKLENHRCLGCIMPPQADFSNGMVIFTASDEVVYKVMLMYHPGMGVPIDITVSRDEAELYKGEIIIR